MQVITIATMSSLPRANALAASLARHQPEWPLSVMLIGRERAVAEAARQAQLLRVTSIAQELDVDVETLLARHDEADLNVLLMPHLLLRHAERTGEAVLHLPSSAWLLADLQPIATALGESGVVLVPRIDGELSDDGLEPSRRDLERAGRIDDTMMAVDGGARSREILRWWAGHVEASLGSLDALRVGERAEDRPWLARFLELAPARFSAGLLDDAGFDLSLWNLDRHTLQEDERGVRVDDARPLRLLNLPGFDPERPHRLAANASRARVSRSPVLRRLCERYASELLSCGWGDLEHRHDVGRRLTSGLVYDDSLRAIYARALALGDGVEDLFGEQGSRAFLAWLEGPAPRGSEHGINRYVFYRVSRERPDVLRTYPDLDGEDARGYVEWCWAFGRHELAIPDRFMPPRGGSAAAHTWSVAARTAGSDERAPAVEAVAAVGPVEAAEIVESVETVMDEPTAPPAEPPDAEGLAVRLTGYLGHTLGLGAAARGYVQALSVAGVPVSTVSVPLHHLELPVRLEDAYGRHGFEDVVHEGGHGFEIVAVNADELPSFVERLGEDYFEGPRIGIWGWETNSIPPRWQRAFALVQEVWVYSRFMAENIGAVAPVPVIALPPPVQPPAAAVQPLRLGR